MDFCIRKGSMHSRKYDVDMVTKIYDYWMMSIILDCGLDGSFEKWVWTLLTFKIDDYLNLYRASYDERASSWHLIPK